MHTTGNGEEEEPEFDVNTCGLGDMEPTNSSATDYSTRRWIEKADACFGSASIVPCMSQILQPRQASRQSNGSVFFQVTSLPTNQFA